MITLSWLKSLCADREHSTLTLRQLTVLLYIHERSASGTLISVSSRKLSDQLGLPASGAYRSILGLLERGLLLKHTHQWSQKKFSYSLSPLGLKLTQSIKAKTQD